MFQCFYGHRTVWRREGEEEEVCGDGEEEEEEGKRFGPSSSRRTTGRLVCECRALILWSVFIKIFVRNDDLYVMYTLSVCYSS